ncbi:MAG TPA: PP2C family protein-serine/threonine phosphatase [Candidatus Babeliales bacterium]|nr:PP2C family protein-serine/threonine phosphatase [Candidatus Babeliales bacterium]
MKFVKYIVSMVALVTTVFVDCKQMGKASAAVVEQTQKPSMVRPEMRSLPQPIKAFRKEYENILSTLKTLQPSREDLPILEQIKNEIDNQIKGLARFPEIKKPSKFNITYGHSTHKNKRPYQEDRFDHAMIDGDQFFAIYDGHGGDEVSSFLKDNLHDYFAQCLISAGKNKREAFECAFAKAEDYSLKNYDAGSTAVVAFIESDILHLAWVGDSRAVLESNSKPSFPTEDHKPDSKDEKERIERAGGQVYWHGVWRVNGLAVSRSIGDRKMKVGKEGQIIAMPEYAEIQLNKNNHFMILASDGLWDTISSEEAVAMVNKGLEDNKSLNDIAQELQNAAIAKGSGDNITVCVVKF